MKILHTADWHLGKRLCGKSRLIEQKDVLDEIAEIADAEKVDAVVVAGDVFDTSVPPAESEELFYRACLKLAAGRCLIASAGNHDDPARLCAPSGLAKALDIFLINGKETPSGKFGAYETGDGFVKISKGGEKLNIAVLPYPQHSALASGENKDKPYALLVKNKLDALCGSVFDGDSYNMLVTHLFATKSGDGDDADGVLSDERTLGTASLLPVSVFPTCDYTALGHIHKPMTVSKTRNIIYGGSILSYSFDDLTEKSVVIVEFSRAANGEKTTDVRRVPLKTGRRLIKVKAESFSSALAALKDNAEKYVHLVYKGAEPLTLGEMNELKKESSFCSFKNAATSIKRETAVRKDRPIKEQFEDFYKFVKKTDAAPPEDMTEMFIKVLNDEEIV